MLYDLIIRDALVIDGSDTPGVRADVAISDGRIQRIGSLTEARAREEVNAVGRVLAPGFIDVHTHDDTVVIRKPEMLPKISQGVTTVIVGNCGISASPVSLRGNPPDPMNLLGDASAFVYPRFADYRAAVDNARPAVNVAALIGHTALRNNHMDDLLRSASPAEIAAMREQLRDSLEAGALGLSTGLAYASAFSAKTSEVKQLAEELTTFGAVYTTHLRSEFEPVLEAMAEAFDIGRHARSPVIISHLKCAGAGNWGRSPQLLAALEKAAQDHPVGCDCYPYAASSSTLDLKQVTDAFRITITWSTPHPDQGGRDLQDIAADWGLSLQDTARKLQPAGAVYYGMDESDVERIMSHPLSMIGSDGLPEDPFPHPRLWGAFPRVLGHFSRDKKLFALHTAVHKMTGLSAARFALHERGLIREGYWADLVLFNPHTVRDIANFKDPQRAAEGIDGVWVNGQLSYAEGKPQGKRQGRFLPRSGSLLDGFAETKTPTQASAIKLERNDTS
ncbi:N-acyl-D-amino acid deacylase family protein [Pseudomonas syringae pv. cilantro]|uniref:N-acyl-D-amino acid deacylase family protein n=2 Tax=Pseudomonas syringae group TaxID=136849 RepID=A0A0N1JQ14_PSESX|nr:MULTISPECIES: D-aminoacylase [Pseudomonas syringae group]KPC35787.1 N-acyl-D-amino acid deacylase family protein [Pseudomonas syringae pv. cilantro]KPW70226.1 N-acyl-D-amino acid deacylase family protein [Pseudomonas syringae pv. coriandricola]RMN07798.1 N-acyl-D-amino acid deacylase protein [Pseudomonas syringae pv. coriandricola]